MWESKSKHDLIIEVWEKLDCENIGRAEIEAIETVLKENFDDSPLDTPMRLARLLADEGAELRHAELLELDVERRIAIEELPFLSRPLDVSSRTVAFKTINELEETRLKFIDSGKDKPLADLRRKTIAARDRCTAIADNKDKSDESRGAAAEIAEWLSMWIQSPEIYKSWIRAKYPKGVEAKESRK